MPHREVAGFPANATTSARGTRAARPRPGRGLRLAGAVAAALALAGCASGGAPPRQAGAVVPLPELARQAEIRRTEHGVPHIEAENLRAAGFALAWVQLEDHGDGIIRGMEAARGRYSLIEGSARVDTDARALRRHALATAGISLLEEDTRDVYDGFAEGMNHFIRVHAARLPDWARPDFTGADVLARDIGSANGIAMARFRQNLLDSPEDARLLKFEDGEWRRSPAGSNPQPPRRREPADTSWNEGDTDDVGSNAWALAPSRTRSGRAILLRNPHLAWTAGYYEAHVRVPGKLDFYGDFRIGGPFTVIGGFNADLGFATTNNASRSHEFYALRLDPGRPGHVLLDGRSVSLRYDSVRVEYVDDGLRGTTWREFIESPIGPVFHTTDSIAYVLREALDGDHRAGEQWLKMMKARNLVEYLEAMRMQARATSNFTYADRAGNIHYVWVSTAPLLPHPAGGDSVAVLVTRTAEAWSAIAPFDSLPQLLNPAGGYIHNENDSPHYTNLNAVMPHSFGFWVEPPRLRLRSQLGASLLHNDSVFSLEDVILRKHTPRMLLAERVKADLVAALRARPADAAAAHGLSVLEEWDGTVTPDSRGGVLFEAWWSRYRSLREGQDLHATEWSPAEPMTTPRGLASAADAGAAFDAAVTDVLRRHGGVDVAWGAVHRVRRGDVDVPVGGCNGVLGCFRVLAFSQPQQDGTRIVNGGDGWILAVEFADTPRAYSVLGYGQSPDTASPYHADQAELFAAGRMKPVRFTEQDIAASAVRRYRPGEQ
jgi:acyl-homoserine-lactone acylase